MNITKKHTDFNGQGLSGDGIAFYTDYVFKHSDGSFADNTIVFGADSQKDDNMLARGQGNIKFNNKTVGIKVPYKTNVSATETKIVLSLHYNKQNNYIFANGNKITDDDPISLGNISKKFSESDTKKSGLYGSVLNIFLHIQKLKSLKLI